MSPLLHVSKMHQYHLHSLAATSKLNGVTLLTSDEITCNLWSVDEPHKFTQVCQTDLAALPKLSEILTAAALSTDGQMACTATNSGKITIHDLRKPGCSNMMNLSLQPEAKFNCMTNAITAVDFAKGADKVVVSRDLLKTRIWDLKMMKEVSCVQLHQPDL